MSDKKRQRKNNQPYRLTMMVQNVVDCGVLTGLTGNCSSSWSVRLFFLTVLSLLRYFGSEKGFIMVGKPLFDHCHRRDDNDGVDCCVAARFVPLKHCIVFLIYQITRRLCCTGHCRCLLVSERHHCQQPFFSEFLLLFFETKKSKP
jgi:hypothetical protein